jgi:Tfp pilus assembly protein PilN
MFGFRNLDQTKVIQVISVELTDGLPVFHFVILQKKAESFILRLKGTFESIEQLAKVIRKRLPIILHIYGKGVLNRKTVPIDDYLDKLILNANKNDFYSTFIDIEHERFVSFTRKEPVDSIIEKLVGLEDQIVDIQLGPFIVLNSNLPDKIKHAGNITFSYNNDGISFESSETSDLSCYFLDVKWNNQLLAGIAAYNELVSDPSCSIINHEERKTRRVNLKDKIQFEKLGVFMLAFFLFALIGNYFYQGHINEKNARIEDEIMIFSDNLTKIDLIDQEINRKKHLIQSSGILKNQYISFYLDQIGITLPSTISLTEIKTFPVTNKLKQKIKPEIDQTSIYISGITQNSSSIDMWIEKLNALDWVAKTEILSFERSDGLKAIFTIKLYIK